MPGYKRMEKYAPETTKEVDNLNSRFRMPKISFIQLCILTLIIYMTVQYKNLNRSWLIVGMFGISILHLYDHMYLVKRGNERFFLSNSEGYCAACKM